MGLSLSLGFPPNTGPAAGGIKPGTPLAAITMSATAGVSASMLTGGGLLPTTTLAATGAVATNVLGVHTFGSGAGIGATGALAAALRADGLRSLPTVTLAATGAIEAIPAVFAPDDLAGLKLWLDFSDISTLFQDSAGTTPVTADADPIGLAVDQSAFAKNATQTTTSAKPTYKTNIQNGLSVARFDGGDWLATAVAQFVGADGTWSAFAVAKASDSSGVESIVDSDDATAPQVRVGQIIRINNTAVESIAFNTVPGAFSDAAGTAHGAAWGVFAAVRGATSVEAFINNNGNGATSTTGTPVSSQNWVAIGATKIEEVTQFFIGDVGEVLLYNNALSTADRQSVQTYLAAKWGITLS